MIKDPSPEVLAAVRTVDAYLVEQLKTLLDVPPDHTATSFVIVGAASLISNLREAFFNQHRVVDLSATVAQPAISPEDLAAILRESP